MSIDLTIADTGQAGRQPVADDVLAWHFIPNNRILRHTYDTHVYVGSTYSAEGTLILCQNGMHASVRPLDALYYAPGSLLCRVRLHGNKIYGEDKLCARHRTVLWIIDSAPVLQEFTLWCAERALVSWYQSGHEPNPALLSALETKRTWLRGESSDLELLEAGDIAADVFERSKKAQSIAWSSTAEIKVVADVTKTLAQLVWVAVCSTPDGRTIPWSSSVNATFNLVRSSAWAVARDVAGNSSEVAAQTALITDTKTSDTGAVAPIDWAIFDNAMAADRDAQNTQLEAALLTLEPTNGVPDGS